MRKLKPSKYVNEFYPDSNISSKTIINWIKRGRLKGEQTPTGRWLVLVESSNINDDQVNHLINLMNSAGL